MNPEADLRPYLTRLLRWYRTLDTPSGWPAIRYGFAILEFVRARKPEPGEFWNRLELTRMRLRSKGDRVSFWSHDLEKAKEIFGDQDPPFVIEYLERSAAGGQVPSESWDGWLFYMDPSRARGYLLAGQADAVTGTITSGVPQELRGKLRETETSLRDRILSFVKVQPDMTLEDSSGPWPAIRWKTSVLECQLAEEYPPKYVGYQVQFRNDVLRDSPDHAQSLQERELFQTLLGFQSPQKVTFASSRDVFPKLEFWTAANSDLVFSTIAHLGSVNDRGIVEWSLIPFGTTDPKLLQRFSESEEAADRADELAYAESISKASAVATSLLAKLRGRSISCHRCKNVVEDARSIREWNGEYKVWCPACHTSIRFEN